MMELNEITQYSHKIKIINIQNENKQSLYNYIIVKINLPSSNDEVVRFSLQPNTSFIDHQHIENTNDYYCSIPNQLNQTMILYAHFFPKDLYEYEDEKNDLINIYNLPDILDNAIITSNRYESSIDEDEHLIVQSIDSTSVTDYHDPNYKHYTTTNNINKTEQGFFPLSSRYRTYKNWEVPNLNLADPSWKVNNDDLYWEARIPFENMEGPVKVFINYEYLPTSREYHQHYFGFEGIERNNNTINVFEGTNINTLDNKFGSNNNYRIINLGNPYDDKRSIYVPHENIIPIDLDTFTPHIIDNKKTCEWEKNKCQDYYIYTPLFNTTNGYCSKILTSLTPGHYYSLRYYIYIPNYAHVEEDKCYIAVETDDDIYKMDDTFIYRDKQMRNQWIYHEVPFLATNKNIIKIIGPQSFNIATDTNNNIFFTNMSLYEMVEYSPTLQYTNTSLRLLEQDQVTFKPVSDSKETVSIIPDDKEWTLSNTELPIPYDDVYIDTDNETEVIYDPYTTNIYYKHPTLENDEDRIVSYDYSTTNLTFKNINDDVTFSNNDTEVYVNYKKQLTGVYGPNNNFTFKFTNINGDYVNSGTVEAGIFLTKDSTNDISTAEIKLSQQPVKVNGIVTFSNIDLTHLNPNSPVSNKYYIRLKYTNPCLEDTKIIFKTLYLYKEEVIIDNLKINFKNNDKYKGNINDEINKQINALAMYVEDIDFDSNYDLSVTDIERSNINHTNIVTDVDINSNGDLLSENTIIKSNMDTINRGIQSVTFNNDGDLIIDFINDDLVADFTNDNFLNTDDDIIISDGYKIEVRIRDQDGNLKTDGYCELSINDKLNQTTIVDNGWVDFYVDLADLKPGCQTLKIEYYRQYYKSLGFIYFDLCVNSDFDPSKTIVPVNIRLLENGITKALSVRFFEDKGVTDNQNTHYWNTSKWVDRDTQFDGTTLSNTRSTSSRNYYPIPNEEILNANNVNVYRGNCTIELDLIEYSGTSYIMLSGPNLTSFYRSWANLGCTGGEHIKIVNKNNTQSIYINNNKTPKWTKNNIYNTEPYAIRFVLSTGASLKFKNLKITNHEYHIIEEDDTVLNTITTGSHTKFKLEVYKDNVLMFEKNIYNKNNSIDFLSHEYGDTNTHLYTIKTGNILDGDGEPIEDLYYNYEKSFLIQKNPT